MYANAKMCDNDLSIYFAEKKAKCIRFSKEKNLLELDIKYSNNKKNS